MRTVLVMALVVALGGCYSIRHRHDAEGTASTTSAKPSKRHEKQAKEVLPAGLAGDKANHAYTGEGPH